MKVLLEEQDAKLVRQVIKEGSPLFKVIGGPKRVGKLGKYQVEMASADDAMLLKLSGSGKQVCLKP